MNGKEQGASVQQGNGLRRQLWRFGLVGVAAFAVNAGLVECLAPSLGPVWSQLVAFPVAATVAWRLNRQYTFGASGLAPHREWLRYVLANSAGWLLNNATYFIIVGNIPLACTHPGIAVAAGSIAGLTANFLLSRRVVFRKEPLAKKSSRKKW